MGPAAPRVVVVVRNRWQMHETAGPAAVAAVAAAASAVVARADTRTSGWYSVELCTLVIWSAYYCLAAIDAVEWAGGCDLK